MRETQWRTNLVKGFKDSHRKDQDFIWAMDAKFKAGFPDLYIINRGRPFHYELKVVEKWPDDIMKDHLDLGIFAFDMKATYGKFFDKIQLSIMRSINDSGVEARGLILVKDLSDVVMINFFSEKIRLFSKKTFTHFWSGDHLWPNPIPGTVED